MKYYNNVLCAILTLMMCCGLLVGCGLETRKEETITYYDNTVIPDFGYYSNIEICRPMEKEQIIISGLPFDSVKYFYDSSEINQDLIDTYINKLEDCGLSGETRILNNGTECISYNSELCLVEMHASEEYENTYQVYILQPHI